MVSDACVRIIKLAGENAHYCADLVLQLYFLFFFFFFFSFFYFLHKLFMIAFVINVILALRKE
jgi:hypothetical protein